MGISNAQDPGNLYSLCPRVYPSFYVTQDLKSDTTENNWPVSSSLPLAVPHVLSATTIRTGGSFLCYQKHNRPYKPEHSLPSSAVLILGPSGCACAGQSLEVRWCVACWWREHWCLMVVCYFRLVIDDDGRNVSSPFFVTYLRLLGREKEEEKSEFVLNQKTRKWVDQSDEETRPSRASGRWTEECSP